MTDKADTTGDPNMLSAECQPPLAGVRVLEVAELIPGPLLGLMLRELGAEVVKVERPPFGDMCRLLSMGVFDTLNRGKSSITLDLKQPADRQQLTDMIGDFDILIESYRPGVTQRLGIDYDTLSKHHSGLIYASVSGYGQNGPWAAVTGHDINYAGMAGVLALSPGPAGAPPASAGMPIADIAGAQQALNAILAALFQRTRTGRGQFLDISITDVLLYWMNVRLGAFYTEGLNEPAEQRKAALTRPAYGAFRCRDGQDITIAALEDHFWHKLCDVLGLNQSLPMSHESYEERLGEADDINNVVAAACSREDRDPLLNRLLAAGVPAAPLLQPFEIFSHPQLVERDIFVPSKAGTLVKFPVKLEGTGMPLRSAPDLSPGGVPPPV